VSTTAGQDTLLFEVLHALRIKGMAQPSPLAASVGLDGSDLDAALGRLRASGSASYLEARGLWRLTPEGRMRHARMLDEQVPAETQDELRPGYQRFLSLNGQLKELCARWQLRDAESNDHSDADYDQGRIAELAMLHPRAAAVIADLAAVQDRFERYGRRLSSALARVHDGDLKAFTGVLCESYHDIWMELHRDLLLSLRIDREAEEGSGRPAGTAR
jgi:hypothetical protein